MKSKRTGSQTNDPKTLLAGFSEGYQCSSSATACSRRTGFPGGSGSCLLEEGNKNNKKEK